VQKILQLVTLQEGILF